MPAPRPFRMPRRHDGRPVPNPVRWLCDSGHLHPTHRRAVDCNIARRVWESDQAAREAAARCQACGRVIAKRPRAGKLRYPHRCPHGRACPAGDALRGSHLNNPVPARLGGCPGCAARDCAAEE